MLIAATIASNALVAECMITGEILARSEWHTGLNPSNYHPHPSAHTHTLPSPVAAKIPGMETVQYNLPQDRIPRAWYNIAADLPTPVAPPLHPGTLKPIGPDDLAPLFPMALIMQEVSTEREIEIPDPVRQIYAQWRPSPLFRARRLEKALDTPARIYYKYEGVSPAGSHKPNTAVAQAW